MNGTNENTDKQLLLRVSEGDEQAFEQLVYQYSEKVFFHALTFVRSWHQAEEMLQDIFLRVWQKRDKLPLVEDWEKYLFVLSRNLLINAIQKNAPPLHGELIELEDAALRPDDQYAGKELGRLIQMGVDRLPEQKRQVFQMVHQEGLTQEEVGRKLGIATRTVRWNLVSAINELKDFLHRRSADTLYLLLLSFSIHW